MRIILLLHKLNEKIGHQIKSLFNDCKVVPHEGLDQSSTFECLIHDSLIAKYHLSVLFSLDNNHSIQIFKTSYRKLRTFFVVHRNKNPNKRVHYPKEKRDTLEVCLLLLDKSQRISIINRSSSNTKPNWWHTKFI